MTNSTIDPIDIAWLGGPEIKELSLGDAEIIDAVELGLRAQGLGQTVIEPRMHLQPDPAFRGHFNVLRGYISGDAYPDGQGYAGVKTVSDYIDNYTRQLPSEMALLNLFDPKTGAPLAVIDAAGITDMRTGAVTAIGAKYLARKDSKVLGHIGARGTAYWNVRLLDSLFDFDEIRVHSRRPESREAFAGRLSDDLGKPVIATADWQSCLDGADIMVEASRLEAPMPHFRTEWVKPGAFVVPYGTMSAVELSLTDVMDKMVVDDWGQCKSPPANADDASDSLLAKLGALRSHVDAGKLSIETLHAELGQIVAGLKPGRETEQETNLLWHRGLSTSDIALGVAMLHKARSMGIGHTLRYA